MLRCVKPFGVLLEAPVWVMWGLFVSAFLSATLIPMASEGVLAGLVAVGGWDPWLLWGVATAGNVVGAVVNWGLGLGIGRFQGRRWFPVSESAMARARGWFQRWGVWTLLFSWVPMIGDPLTIVAGAMGVRMRVFLPLVALGKGARYAVVILAMLGLLEGVLGPQGL